MSAESPREQGPQDEQLALVREKVRLFFSTWAKKHATEIADTGFLESHPAQDPSVPLTEAAMPADETTDEFAQRIKNVVSVSFESTDVARDFFASLDQPYPYAGGNGRTFLEVLEQDFLSQGKGVAPILAHIDKGLTDVPRATGLLRGRLVQKYGTRYLDAVGEVASKTIPFETIYGTDAPDVLAVLGKTIYVAPTTGSVDEILERCGLSRKDYEDITAYVNGLAVFPIAHTLRERRPNEYGETEPGQVLVFSATGKRAEITHETSGLVKSIALDTVETNSARLISFASALWPISIAQDRIELGPLMPIDRTYSRSLPKEQRYTELLAQIEDGMDSVAALTDRIIGQPVTAYKRLTPRRDSSARV